MLTMCSVDYVFVHLYVYVSVWLKKEHVNECCGNREKKIQHWIRS